MIVIIILSSLLGVSTVIMITDIIRTEIKLKKEKKRQKELIERHAEISTRFKYDLENFRL